MKPIVNFLVNVLTMMGGSAPTPPSGPPQTFYLLLNNAGDRLVPSVGNLYVWRS